MYEDEPRDVRIPAEVLSDLTVRALCAAGASQEQARVAAEVLVAADLRGVESHGVARLAHYYVDRLRCGEINRSPSIGVVTETQSTALLEGDGGLGFAVGRVAMDLATDKARATGAGFVSARNSTHFGAAFPYARWAAELGMVGISMTTGGRIVAPCGGTRRGIGANALCIAAPCRDAAPFVLDMATSVVAGGKLEVAARRGRRAPAGWILDREGAPCTDPREYFLGGALLPLGAAAETGGYKGLGLAFAVDVLCSMLSGAPPSPILEKGANHFFGALRIDAFVDAEAFRDRMDACIRALKAGGQPDGGEITYAGELEEALEHKRRAAGIPLHPSVVTSLRLMCDELGIEADLPD